MLSGARINIDQVIIALKKHESKLHEFVATSGFSAQDVSSILSGAGKYLEKAIIDLVKSKHHLHTITEESDYYLAECNRFAGRIWSQCGFIHETLFTPANISTMLGNSGKNIDSAIRDMVEQQTILQELSTNSSFYQNLSTLLKDSGVGIKQAIEAIVKRSAKLEQYLDTS